MEQESGIKFLIVTEDVSSFECYKDGSFEYYAREYDYESDLESIYKALGWQGGTIHQVVEEIKRLKKLEAINDK